HWDTGDKMGHFLEDFWHMISSFEAQLERPDQKKWFELFMEIKYGERAKKKMKEHAVDSNLVAVYRNLRKRDLVAIKYALKDEYLANEGHEEISNAISERREQHQEKFIYYTEQSQYHLDNMLTELRARYKDRLDNPVKIQLEERELSAYNYLKQLSSEVNKKGLDESNAKLFLEYFEKLDKMASEMEDPDMVKTVSAISRVGKVIVLKHAVMKSHSYPEIKFESLLDEKNRDYLETQLERIR
ncbi:hypothetical protein KY339_02675, partial [Candidatus Woesearchaeota archaeon]|nr:hypothetical protein [Candidatus Woesearchaeota archaeon]